MSKQKEQMMSVRILPNTTSNPPGKLADAEVVFEADAGPLTGLKLIGFAVWERRAGGRNVTFPPGSTPSTESAGASRCCVLRMATQTRKRRFETPSSKRTAASRPHPDRPSRTPGGRPQARRPAFTAATTHADTAWVDRLVSIEQSPRTLR